MEDNLTEFEGSQVQGLDLDIQDDDDVLSSLNVANETAKRLNDSRLERVADVDEANAALIEQQEEQADINMVTMKEALAKVDVTQLNDWESERYGGTDPD